LLVGRYYDPATDQFLSVDPDVAETMQPYAFTGDDPLNATDPLGLSTKFNPENPATWSRGNYPRGVREGSRVWKVLQTMFKRPPGKGITGNGSSVAAVENEARTGKPTNGKYHETSARDEARGFENAIGDPATTPAEAEAGRAAIQYANTALNAFDTAVTENVIPVGEEPGQLNPERGAIARAEFNDEVDLGQEPVEPWVASPEAGGGDADGVDFDIVPAPPIP
jgi:hypothetical protein